MKVDILPIVIYGRFKKSVLLELEELLKTMQWPPPEEPSPEFHYILIAIDQGILLKDLQQACRDLGLSTRGHKKILAARLLDHGYEPAVVIAEKAAAEFETDGGEVE